MHSQLLNDLVAAWNDHDVERVLGFYASDYEEEDVGQARPGRGLRQLQLTLHQYMRAFPDLRLVADQMVIDGDQAALAWTLSGTHQGTIMNIPPTGRAVRVRGVTLLTFAGGKITRGRRIWDVAGLLRALGLLPEL